jgi:Amt family ammonium transporter
MAAHLGTPDSGDTAFVIICSVLVLMMTLPGLMLFYGALRAKSPVDFPCGVIVPEDC